MTNLLSTTSLSSNQTFADVAAYLKRVRELGREFGQGALSRPEFIIQTAIAAQEGTIDESNAEEAQNAYAEACNKKLAGNVALKDSETSHNQRVSELRTIIHVAAFDFLSEDTLADMLTEAKGLILSYKQEGAYKGNTTDGFMRIVRAQKAKKKAGEDERLNEDELRAAILGNVNSAELTEKKSLERIKKMLDVHLKGTKGTTNSMPKPAFPSVQADAMLALCEERLAETR